MALSDEFTVDKDTTLKEVFNFVPVIGQTTTGTRALFQNMYNQETKPDFCTDETLCRYLDNAFKNKYGNRIVAPGIVDLYDGNADQDITAADFCEYLASEISSIYKLKWDKLYATLSFDYDPIANVDANITDTETRDLTNTRDLSDTDKGSVSTGTSGTDTTAHTGTDNVTHSGTDNLKTSGTDTTEHTGTDEIAQTGTGTQTGKAATDVYGFNSSTAVPTGDNNSDITDSRDYKDTTTHDTADTNTKNISNDRTIDTSDDRTINTSDSTTYGKTEAENRDLTQSHTGTVQDTGTITHIISRKGNIGVTMTQQMINAERDVWNWFFYDVVFKDCADYLSIPCY